MFDDEVALCIRRVTVAVMGAVLILPLSARAENLLELYKLAKDADPKLAAAIHEHRASKEVVPQAWADYRPTASLGYDSTNTTQNIISSDNSVFGSGQTKFPTKSWNLNISQPVFRYANYLRVGQAKLELAQADAKLVDAQQELMIRLSEAYLNVLANKDNLTFLKYSEVSAQRSLTLAQARETAAVGRQVDRFEAEARFAAVKADALDAELKLKDQQEALYEMTGKYAGDLWALPPGFELKMPEPADGEQWTQGAMDQNPALTAQRRAVEAASQEIQKQKAGHYPTLDLVLRKGQQDTGGSLFGGGSNVNTTDITLRLNIPLYQGGAVSSKARQAAEMHSSAQAQLMQMTRVTQRKTRESYWQVVNAVTRVQALDKSVSAMEATLKLRRAAYDAGIGSTLSVLDAERDWSSGRMKLSQAKYDYVLNWLKLKALVGVLTENDIEQVNAWFQP